MKCTLCPRECGVDRKLSYGFCGLSDEMRIAKIMLHQWEEPCICYGSGCGAIFFSGCQLKCVFCQNHEISFDCRGRNVSSDELSSYFLLLQEKGACCIDLVSPTPHVTALIPALKKAKAEGLSIPIVYNSGGYEKVETLEMLNGLIDIYMPDFKFYTEEESLLLASAKNYAEVAVKALEEMYRQVGTPQWDGDHLTKGVLIRHLVLPGYTASSEQILEEVHHIFGKSGAVLSLMRQYTPIGECLEPKSLRRKVTTLEYERVVKKAENLGFSFVFTQKKESADCEFIPDFSVFSDGFR